MKSPQSTCGVYVGLCFPIRTVASFTANRPTTCPSASISIQSGLTSPGFAKNDFVTIKILKDRSRAGGIQWQLPGDDDPVTADLATLTVRRRRMTSVSSPRYEIRESIDHRVAH